jgi:hypothetical protein
MSAETGVQLICGQIIGITFKVIRAASWNI